MSRVRLEAAFLRMGLPHDAMQRIVAGLDDAGFKIVPRVPTESMCSAGELHANNADAMWRAMLAVSAATENPPSLLRER
jgi:hypothetical protein